MISPCSSTRMVSALRIVDRRWAMIRLVRPCINWSNPRWIKISLRVSMLLVASSSNRMAGSATAARAMFNSCRCPWLRLAPSFSSKVSYPCGKRLMNEWAAVRRAATTTSSSVALRRPKRMFSRTVPVKRWVSCNTIAIERRRLLRSIRSIG